MFKMWNCYPSVPVGATSSIWDMYTSTHVLHSFAVMCDHLPAIDNGWIHYNTNTGIEGPVEGRIAYFNCVGGFTRVGPDRSTCIANPANRTTGIWNQPTPACIGKVVTRVSSKFNPTN